MCTLKCVYFERIQSSSKWAILRTNEWNRKEFFYLSTDAIKRTFAGCFALSDIRLTDQPKAHGLITLTLINTTRRADWRTCHPTRHFRCLLQVYHTDDEQTMQHTFIAIVLMTHTTLSTLARISWLRKFEAGCFPPTQIFSKNVKLLASRSIYWSV